MSDNPVCSQCGEKWAVCFGAYEHHAEYGYACGDCCGHGNEDGHCDMLDERDRDDWPERLAFDAGVVHGAAALRERDRQGRALLERALLKIPLWSGEVVRKEASDLIDDIRAFLAADSTEPPAPPESEPEGLRLREALQAAEQIYEDGHFDDSHADECPGDDTCDCEWVLRINLLFALLQGRDDVAKRMRRALAAAPGED